MTTHRRRRRHPLPAARGAARATASRCCCCTACPRRRRCGGTSLRRSPTAGACSPPTCPGSAARPTPAPTTCRRWCASSPRSSTQEVAGPVDVVGHDWGGSLALGARRRPPRPRAPARASSTRPTARCRCCAPRTSRSSPCRCCPSCCSAPPGAAPSTRCSRSAWQADRAARPRGARRVPAPPTATRDRVQAMLGYYRAAAARRRACCPARRCPARRQRAPPAPRGAGRVDARAVGCRRPGAADPHRRVGRARPRPDAVMVTVPGAGHFVVEEAPEVVLEVLRDFLAPDLTPALRAGRAGRSRPGPLPRRAASGRGVSASALRGRTGADLGLPVRRGPVHGPGTASRRSRQGVGDGLVVHPPPAEVRPRLLGRAVHRERGGADPARRPRGSRRRRAAAAASGSGSWSTSSPTRLGDRPGAR